LLLNVTDIVAIEPSHMISDLCSFVTMSVFHTVSDILSLTLISAWCRSRGPFLANVNSRSRLLYAIASPSVVCLLSVTFVHPTQAVVIFGTFSTAFATLAIR